MPDSTPQKINAEEAVRSVFQLLDHRIQGGELDDVRDAMPEEEPWEGE